MRTYILPTVLKKVNGIGRPRRQWLQMNRTSIGATTQAKHFEWWQYSQLLPARARRSRLILTRIFELITVYSAESAAHTSPGWRLRSSRNPGLGIRFT